MKTGNSKGLSFGFASVNPGQRNVHVEPQFIALSTEGGFRITPPVSAALGAANGDYMMFINNISEIDNAIREKNADLVAYCEEAGLDIDSVEAAAAIHAEFDKWLIAKGIQEYDTKGNKKECIERITKSDRVRFVSQNFDAMLEAAMGSEDEELKAALSIEDITKEQQIELLCPFVEAKTIFKVRGSKAANPGGQSGAGVPLTFTDSNVWKQLKADRLEDGTTFNRVYDIDLDSIVTITISNGYEPVEVKCVMLGEYTDKEPARIGARNNNDGE